MVRSGIIRERERRTSGYFGSHSVRIECIHGCSHSPHPMTRAGSMMTYDTRPERAHYGRTNG